MTPKKKYFFEVEKKKLGHSFDAENSYLSIGEVFRAIPALCRELDVNMCCQNFKNPVIFGPYPPTESGIQSPLANFEAK